MSAVSIKRTRAWSDADKEKAADLVTSYVNGLERALTFFQVEQDELDDVLLDMNVEMCNGCGWYVDSCDLIPEDKDEPDGACPNCR